MIQPASPLKVEIHDYNETYYRRKIMANAIFRDRILESMVIIMVHNGSETVHELLETKQQPSLLSFGVTAIILLFHFEYILCLSQSARRILHSQ